MHFTFIAYGARQEVERLFRDIESQKFKLRMYKKGKKDTYVWVNGQIRTLPFAAVDVIFPREYKDTILNTLIGGTAPNRFGVPRFFTALFRKALKIKAIPKYKQTEKFLWCIEHVSIIPIGIREDRVDFEERKDMGYKGWYHEAL